MLSGVFATLRAPRPCITVAEVEPERSIVFEQPSHFSKYFNYFGDVGERRVFHADLSCYAIVTQTKIWG